MAKELQYTSKDIAVNLLCRECSNEFHTKSHGIALRILPIPNKFQSMVNEINQKKDLTNIEKYDYISSFIFDSMFQENLIIISKKIAKHWLHEETNKISNNFTLPLAIKAIIIKYSTTSYELPNKVCKPFEQGTYGICKLRKIIDKINSKYKQNII